MIGKQLGTYQLIEKIGEGGMAIVYKAEQTNLQRMVAIKILPPQLSFNEQFVKRFRREALAVARLNHPNIVQIFDVGEVDGVHYFAMEYVSETNLAHYYFERNKVIDPLIATRICLQIAEALDYAHEKGIIHRDIKPANILMDENLTVKVTDFGIAHLADSTILTSAGTKIGTPKYMSPEQARGEIIDGRSDLYSLGIILFELMTGSAPFKVKADHAMLHDHIYTPHPQPSTINPQIDPFVEKIICRCLEKKPEDRFVSGQELADALKQFIKILKKELLPLEIEEKSEPEAVTGIVKLAQQRYLAQTQTKNYQTEKQRKQAAAAQQETQTTPSQEKEEMSVTRLYQQADLLVAESKLAEACDIYQKIVAAAPTEAKAHFQIGFISSQLGNHDQVVPHYFKAVQQKTDYFEEAHIVLGQAYLNSRHYPQAINEFKIVLSKNPKKREIKYLLEIARFSAIIVKNPNSAEAHNGLGYAYYQSKEFAKALAEYKKAIRLNPTYSSAHFNLGVLSFNIGRYADAKSHYLKAVELDPKHPQYHYGLGLAYYKMEERRRAYKEWKQTLKLSPDHTEARRALDEY